MGPRLAKLYFVYDDGTVCVVEGESIEKWMEASIATAQIAFAHAGGKTGFEGVEWKPVTEVTTIVPRVPA